MKPERKPARVTYGELHGRGRARRWCLWLACKHVVWRTAAGIRPKLPRKVNSCEKCEQAARMQTDNGG